MAGKLVQFKGLSSSKFVEMGDIPKTDYGRNKGVLLQLLEEMKRNPEITEFLKDLENFSEVFEEPQGPNPTRAQDHFISLLPSGTKPISAPPFRYLYCKKHEIEKFVRLSSKEKFHFSPLSY